VVSNIRHEELAQQSKIRQKMDFIEAFAPVMAEGISVAYKGAPSEIQGKIKRVVDVWRDRKVFEDAIQDAVDSRIAGVSGSGPYAF
jgi:regulator of Ty1 transposition protein 103